MTNSTENWSAIQTGVRTNGARVSIVNIRLVRIVSLLRK